MNPVVKVGRFIRKFGTGAPQATALVLGGGFAGLEAAIGLSQKGLNVTLVSDREEMFIYPTSIWMVTGQHQRKHDTINLKIAATQYAFQFVHGKVDAIHPESKSATVNGKELRGDFLVLAMGSGKMSMPGIANTHTICGKPEDTETLHEALERLIASSGGRIAFGFGGNPKDKSAVRGGPLFEVIFNVHQLLKKRKVRDRFELTFFAPMPNPGVRMGEKAADAVHRMLAKIDVAQRVGKKITRFDETGVVFEDDSRLDTDLTVFVPASTGHPLIHSGVSPEAALPATSLPVNTAGFVTIDGQCRVSGFENVYAIGDAAAIEGPQWRAKQGHLTVEMARIAVKSIVATVTGSSVKKDYRDHVNILCIMDTATGAAIVKRTTRKATMIYLPFIGHLLKKAWGYWYRLSHG